MPGYLKVRWCPPAVAVLLSLVTGCHTAPKPPAKTAILPPPPATPNQAVTPPAPDEAALGRAAFGELKIRERISEDPIYTAQVRRVSKRLARPLAVDFPGVKWAFAIFDAPRSIEAFALPGGRVGIDSGLLKIVESDAELAYVLSHVIAHVTAGHGVLRMNENALVMEASLKARNNRGRLLTSYGVAADGAPPAFSRAHEGEADFIALHYAAKAGYDPHAAIDFWRKMATQSDASHPPKFLRVHPLNETRVTNLERWLPEVMPVYEEARFRYE
jgi:predicted Zn-dependent protease